MSHLQASKYYIRMKKNINLHVIISQIEQEHSKGTLEPVGVTSSYLSNLHKQM